MSDYAAGENPVRERARERAADVAAGYRDADWDALMLQPANVVPIPVGPELDESRPDDADVGLNFLLPESEFDLLAELVAAEPEREVIRGGGDDRAAVIVVLRDAEGGRALTIPLTFPRQTSTAMARAARERGRLDLLVRPANTDRDLRIPLDPEAVIGESGGRGAVQ